jgi:protein phosphatase
MNTLTPNPVLSPPHAAELLHPGGPRLAVRSFGLTDPGKVRPRNEDNFLIAELAKSLCVRQSSLRQEQVHYSDQRGYLFIVADGMGGHQAGDQASSLAVTSIEAFTLNTFKWFFHLKGTEEKNVLAEFQAALRQADARLIDKADGHPEFQGMGTTLTMAYNLGVDLFVVHVGDSRCYLFRQGELRRLTRDHTLTDELVRRGALTPEDAARHPYRHVITNCVGGTVAGLEAEAHKLELAPGDALLLCSDGLTEMVPDESIREVLRTEDGPQAACERLVAEANARGGKDNITVILARFDPAE